MPAAGTEFVSLAQLKDYDDNRVTSGLDAKLNAPASDGTNGQMLVYGSSGNQWTDVPESIEYSADNETLQLSGTQFSVKDGGITADKLASGVIPDVSEFITAADANEAYAAKSHTHAASQVTGLTASRALVSDASGHPSVSTVTSTELGYLDGVTSAIQTQLNGKAATSHTHANATTSADGFMSSEDKTKLDGLQGQIDETKRLKPVNEISAGTDLDTLTEPGSWFCDDSTSVANVPGGVAAEFLLYVYSGGGYIAHELHTLFGTWWRWKKKDASSWDVWIRVLAPNGPLPLESGGTGADNAADARTALGLGNLYSRAPYVRSINPSTLKVKTGTSVVMFGNSSATLFTASQMTSLLGRAFNHATDAVLVMSGDGDAQAGQLMSASTYIDGTTQVYARYRGSSNVDAQGPGRINWVVVYS